MKEVLVVVLLLAGAALLLIAAIGVVRMPDTLTRTQPATKGATFGLACVLAAVAVHFGTVRVATNAVLVIVFLFVTMPVAAHMVARAAYRRGVPLWPGSVIDELRPVVPRAPEPRPEDGEAGAAAGEPPTE